MEKLKVVALFGGQSSEHVVSCMSVQNVAANINKEKYNVILVGITEEGRWLKVDSLDEVKNDTWRTSGSRAVLSPDATEKVLWVIRHGKAEKIPVDVVFPVLHGLYGILINALWISCPKWFSSCIYIAMGWICVTAFGQILSSLTPGAFGWLLAGGIIYTAGGVIYALKLPLFNSRHKNFGSHEIFHLFVMGGSFCHYMMMYGYLAAA